MANKKIINKLPAIFRTPTEEKFFGATFDQAFSKRDSVKYDGLIGRRVSGLYDPINDYYLPEQTKGRTWYQLEPIAVTKDQTSLAKSNQFFYEDLTSKIKVYGGKTDNHDRLFSSDYYSYSPPINADMYTNYQNYYWMTSRLPVINIYGMNDAQIEEFIIGTASFTTDTIPSVTPAGLVFSSGLRVQFVGSVSYRQPYTIERVGDYIELVADYPDLIGDVSYSLIPWDSNLLIPGQVNNNSAWDSLPWDSVESQAKPDYITIERGSYDHNAWSRTNKWYHIDVLNQTLAFTGIKFPTTAVRAQRPIIEFVKNLELFNSGSQYLSDVTYLVDGANEYAKINGIPLSTVRAIYELGQIQSGDILLLRDDITPLSRFLPWDENSNTPWDGGQNRWWDIAYYQDLAANGEFIRVCDFLWQVRVDSGTVYLDIYNPITGTVGSLANQIKEGDIVLITAGQFENKVSPLAGESFEGNRGETWYFNSGTWTAPYNQKTRINQSPLFQLYDSFGSKLNDESKYPNNNFNGSKIFSYKENTEPGSLVDYVLGISLVYKDLGQISDIIFQNDLMTSRVEYLIGDTINTVPGYYYYRSFNTITDKLSYSNSWYTHSEKSKQSVIDRWAVQKTSEMFYEISVYPVDRTSGTLDMSVVKSGTTLNRDTYQVVTHNGSPFVKFDSNLVTFKLDDSLEIRTYTYDPLPADAKGYFEIPQQLEANPTNLEIYEYSYSEFSPHFVTIMQNQVGFTGNAYGQSNNYRDTPRDLSTGTLILQNDSSLLKPMLSFSENNIDVFEAISFASDEYVRFKNKFLKTANSLSDLGFLPTIASSEDMVTDQWIDEIINIVTISKEFSKSFANSNMIFRGDTYTAESSLVDLNNTLTLNNFVDLSNPNNSLAIYKKMATSEFLSENGTLLLDGYDYDVVDSNNIISIKFKGTTVLNGDSIVARLYSNVAPAYIPSTPAKMGMAKVYRPTLVLDNSFVTPKFMIVGHDGATTPAYGEYEIVNGAILPESTVTVNGTIHDSTADWRDILLLELETRIYNGIITKFKKDSLQRLPIELVRTGVFRPVDINRYSLNEYNGVSDSEFFKWAGKTNTNYSSNLSYDQLEWRTWNYGSLLGKNPSTSLYDLDVPGHWRGIFQYYYDTFTPASTPWEMLGFSEKPDWWEINTYTLDQIDIYNDNFTGYGPGPWPDTHWMWADIENGYIRRGPRYSKYRNEVYSRPGLTGDLTVLGRSFSFTGPSTNITPTSAGFLPVDSIGETRKLSESGYIFNNFSSGMQNDWIFGDVSPAEYAWMTSSEYFFSNVVTLILTRPSEAGDKLWNTTGYTTVMVDQVVDANTFMRSRLSDEIVHGEIIDNDVVVRYGYQQYISDRLAFLMQDITTNFGGKVRDLGVELAYRLGGFTNSSTVKLRLDSKSASSSVSSPVVPSTNYSISLHTSAPTTLSSYSGVIIRCLGNETFDVFGYDLLNPYFNTLPRNKLGYAQAVSEGGTDVAFLEFTYNTLYDAGVYVRRNNTFYECLETHVASVFITDKWKKVAHLPSAGGIDVTYYTESLSTVETIPYGTVISGHQELFNFLISYGEFLESQGWTFSDIDTINGVVKNWLTSAKHFLFWASTNWTSGNTLLLSPSAEKATFTYTLGYPTNMESSFNGAYSLLTSEGVPLSTQTTSISREDGKVSVEVLGTDNIFFVRVLLNETEHILNLDNVTDFNDVIYDPVLRTRQERIRFVGVKSSNWTGKLEANGYLINDSELIPNFDNVADSGRQLYDTENFSDSPFMESAARHLTGYQSKDYLEALDISDDVQYNFYQGFIRDKGTTSAFNKILRSNAITGKEDIKIYEEWALKSSDFGGVTNDNSVEFSIHFNDVREDPQIIRINTARSDVGSVSEIRMFNASAIYSSQPIIVIGLPDLSIIGARPASAVAILGADRRISSINLLDGGFGFHTPPTVSVNGGNTVDLAYAVVLGEILVDDPSDNIIDIDVDDTAAWRYGPNQEDDHVAFGILENTSSRIPNSGYVHFDDVTEACFDYNHLLSIWNVDIFKKPTNGDTIWVAKNRQEDWGVYENVILAATVGAPDPAGNLILEIDSAQFVQASQLDQMRRYLNSTFDISRNLITAVVHITSDSRNQLYTLSYSGTGNQYYVVGSDSNKILASTFTDTNVSFATFLNLRFKTRSERSSCGITSNNFSWIDSVGNGWIVETFASVAHRVYSGYIDTVSIESAYLKDVVTDEAYLRLGVIDLTQGIIPGIADKNISHIMSRDPARYNVASDGRLIDPSRIYGSKQVGQLWWDVSSCRALNCQVGGIVSNVVSSQQSENTKSLQYLKSNWAKFTTGSKIDIYEWVFSYQPPANYKGEGTVRNTTDFVTEVKYDPVTGLTPTVYYFWVSGITKVPENNINRTMASAAVSALLQNPKAQAFSWFTPVQQTNTSVAFIIANSDNIISNKNTVVHIEYKNDSNGNNKHTQWDLVREADSFSTIPDRYWDKIVDSLLGYTSSLDQTVYGNVNGVVNLGNGKVVLPVPATNLGNSMKYGTGIRPQQSAVADSEAGLRVFIEVVNRLLVDIKVWTVATKWNSAIPTNQTYLMVDWYLPGYTNLNTKASVQVENTTDMGNLTGLYDGQLIRVYPKKPVLGVDFYEVYEYNLSSNSFSIVRREKGTVELSTGLFLLFKSSSVRDEFRSVVNAIKTNIFVKDNSTGANIVFFAMLHYILSEQRNIDWAFKTSYISIVQDGKVLVQDRNYTVDLYDQLLNYFTDAKAYHSKVRDTITSYTTDIDTVIGKVIETRDFDIELFFDNVATPVDNLVIDSRTFEGGWDSMPWDAGEVSIRGWDEASKTFITHTFTSKAKWDGEELESIVGTDSAAFIDPDTLVGNISFANPETLPGELVKMHPNESIVITVDDIVYSTTAIPWDENSTQGWDELNWDGLEVDMSTPPVDISYRIHLDSLGGTQYTVNASSDMTTLATALTIHSTEIPVLNAAVLPVPTNMPAAVWIGDERIEYYGIDGNRLVDIVRGTMGTSIVAHITGTIVVGSSESLYIPDADKTKWFNLIYSTTLNDYILVSNGSNAGNFLINNPGSVLA